MVIKPPTVRVRFLTTEIMRKGILTVNKCEAFECLFPFVPDYWVIRTIAEQWAEGKTLPEVYVNGECVYAWWKDEERAKTSWEGLGSSVASEPSTAPARTVETRSE